MATQPLPKPNRRVATPDVGKAAADPGFVRFLAECYTRFGNRDWNLSCQDQAEQEGRPMAVATYPLPPALARLTGQTEMSLALIGHGSGPGTLFVLFGQPPER